MIDNLQTPLYRTNQIRSRSTLLYKPYIFIFLICLTNSNRCSKNPYLLIYWYLAMPNFLSTVSYWDTFLYIVLKMNNACRYSTAICPYKYSKWSINWTEISDIYVLVWSNTRSLSYFKYFEVPGRIKMEKKIKGNSTVAFSYFLTFS